MATEAGDESCGAPMDATTTPQFHRKLDRTLEHRTKYENMSSVDRNLICDLRSSVEGCKKKVEYLKDELERSEYECEKNGKLRHVAEERLRRHLVSMYTSPNVDEELRKRLPRANKSCPHFSVPTDNHQEMRSEEGERSCELSEGFLSQHAELRKVSSARCSLDFDTAVSSSQCFTSMMNDSEDVPFPKDTHHASCMPFMTAASPIEKPQHATPNNKATLTVARQFVHSTPLAHAGTTVLCHNCSRPAAFNQSDPKISLGQVEVQLLQEKVTSLVDANRKLTEKLATNGVEDHQTVILDKIREIYEAQKKQEDAVMNRMRQAYEERDEVLHHLRQLQEMSLRVGDPDTRDDHSHKRDDDDDLDLSPSGIEEKGVRWAKEIKQYQERLQEITRDEMNTVISERDNALEKCHDLEKKFIQMERYSNAYSLTSTTEQSLQNKLEIIRKERDYALMKAHKTDEELQNFKIYYSLHRSLSKGGNQSEDEYHNVAAQHDQMRSDRSLMDGLQGDNNHLVAEVTRLASDNSHLAGELKNVRAAYDDVKATKKQLETLVTVLRRKLKNSAKGS